MQDGLVFIVRLWVGVEPQSDFRASVLRVGTDEALWFTQAAALASYLTNQVRHSDP
jgi:hypothetical protein